MNISFAFRSMLAMLTSFFSAGEKIGKTLDNLATVAEETSGVYVDEARAERLAKIAAREAAAQALLPAPVVTTVAPVKAVKSA